MRATSAMARERSAAINTGFGAGGSAFSKLMYTFRDTWGSGNQGSGGGLAVAESRVREV